jgi:hypothetical protein
MNPDPDPIARNLRSNLPTVVMGGPDFWAQGIVEDPQAHIDALVEAGVLRRSGIGTDYYFVVPPEPPHDHNWRWTPTGIVVCLGCDKSFLPSRDQYPKYEGEVPVAHNR